MNPSTLVTSRRDDCLRPCAADLRPCADRSVVRTALVSSWPRHAARSWPRRAAPSWPRHAARSWPRHAALSWPRHAARTVAGLGTQRLAGPDQARRKQFDIGPANPLPLPPLTSRPLKYSLGVWGSAVSSPSRVWGRAPAEIEFGAF